MASRSNKARAKKINTLVKTWVYVDKLNPSESEELALFG